MSPGSDGALDRILSLTEAKPSGKGWTARCPAHEDGEPSLSIDVGDDGRVLLKCFAGCSSEDIVQALGIEMKDLFPSSQASESAAAGGHHEGCTLTQYAGAKKLPQEFLRGLGLADMSYLGAPAMRIPYRDEQGSEAAVRFRVALNKGEGKDARFRWRKGDKPLLYGLWRLPEMKRQGHLVLVEGESDCHTLWRHDLPALGLPGAGSWREEWAEHLEGFDPIYVVIEPDQGGEAVRRWLRNSQIRGRARLVTLDSCKDPSELYLADPGRFHERWAEALAASRSWADIAAGEDDHTRRGAWERCQELASEGAILDRFAEVLAKRGVVGEEKSARILFLALMSRFLERPVSVAVKGPSTGGKSHLVEGVLGFFPPQAYHMLSAMSERALAYSEEPLRHRFLVLAEAAGMQGEFGTYLIRSLLSEGRLRYETVEKTKDGLRPRLIEREGPTGLLVTTTGVSLHPENETRMLSVYVNDTAEQTRRIFETLARENPEPVDLEPWQALQTWIEKSHHSVLIPYALSLVRMIPPLAVRLRRDVKAVLNLIRAHAILHQASRQVDASGRILATLDDYSVVRELVVDSVSDSVEATVLATVRQTVEAVQKVIAGGATEATVHQVSRELRLDKSAALRRVRTALARGYLSNLEDRKGHAARLVMGDPLPEDVCILPTVDDLERGCRVAAQPEGIHTSPSPPTPGLVPVGTVAVAAGDDVLEL